MRSITKSLIFISLCFITLILSSYTVYGHNNRNIDSYSGYNKYCQIKNCRKCKNGRHYYRDNYYYYKKNYNIYKQPYRSNPIYRNRYRRYGCK